MGELGFPSNLHLSASLMTLVGKSERRVVFHATNGIGLGHLSRQIAIALAVREQAPHTNILFVVDGGSHGLLEAAGLSYITAPLIIDNGASAYWQMPRKSQVWRSFAHSIVQVMRPDIILFDCFVPFPFLAAARSSRVPFAICARKMKEMDQFFNSLAKTSSDVQLILIPHDPDEINVPDTMKEKTRFVGQIARPFSRRRAEVTGLALAPRIVITGGGGGYPNTVDFYNVALAAFAACRFEEPSLTGLLVTGPLFKEWRRLEPVEGVHIIPFDPDLTATFAAADLVISQAGYNTIAEITALSVPAICIPAQRKFDDQYERAASASATHPQIHLCSDPDPGSLAAFMLRILQCPRVKNDAVPSLPGATLAAEFLIATINNLRL
jgi:UDP-N-acetylglucosamine--N-acetylmuramyl-(pentapeptide) pyrophosphoryl-undecaprenol N-acetylglucosamine transferase